MQPEASNTLNVPVAAVVVVAIVVVVVVVAGVWRYDSNLHSSYEPGFTWDARTRPRLLPLRVW